MLKPFTIHSALISDMGLIRRHNEDAHYCNGSFCALEDMDRHVEHYEELTADKALFAICDGMGGQQHGEKAAYTAVRQMKELHQQLPGRDFHIVLQHWIRQTTTLVREASDGGGCTLALLYVEDHMLRVCHVGDSRIYRFHHSQLTRLTPDRAISLEELAAELANDPRSKTVVGDGARLCFTHLTEVGISCRLAPAHLVMQNAMSVALEAEAMAAEGNLVSAQALEPVYLRPAQADRLRQK